MLVATINCQNGERKSFKYEKSLKFCDKIWKSEQFHWSLNYHIFHEHTLEARHKWMYNKCILSVLEMPAPGGDDDFLIKNHRFLI